MMTRRFVAFDNLTAAQKAAQAARFEYRLKRDGEVSLKLGDRQLTQEADLELRRSLRGEDVRTKGDISHFRSTTFHFAPEKP